MSRAALSQDEIKAYRARTVKVVTKLLAKVGYKGDATVPGSQLDRCSRSHGGRFLRVGQGKIESGTLAHFRVNPNLTAM